MSIDLHLHRVINDTLNCERLKSVQPYIQGFSSASDPLGGPDKNRRILGEDIKRNMEKRQQHPQPCALT